MLIWIIVAGLTAAGLAAVLWPLLRANRQVAERADYDLAISRDQLKEVERDVARGVLSEAEGENVRREVSRRMLAADAQLKKDRAGGASNSVRIAAAGAALVAVPLLSVSVYLKTGSPQMEDRPLEARLTGPVNSGNFPELVARVERTLRQQPDNLQGWTVIAPVYTRLRRFNDAANAYRQILAIQGPDATVLTDLGEALVMAQDGQVSDDARKAFSHALALNPSLPKPQYFLAIAASQDGRTDEAVAAWRKLLADAPQDAPWRPVVEQQIALATGQGNTAAAPSQDSTAGVKAPALSQEAMAGAAEMTPQQRQQMIEGMVERLATRLNDEGGKAEDWLRLARAQTVLGRNKEAQTTLERARKMYRDKAEDLARINAFGADLGLNETSVASVKAPALSQEAMAGAAEMTPQQRQQMIEGMVERLATRLNDQGGAVDEWLRLARAQTVLGRNEDATMTLARARKIYQDKAEDVARINAFGAELGLTETQ